MIVMVATLMVVGGGDGGFRLGSEGRGEEKRKREKMNNCVFFF